MTETRKPVDSVQRLEEEIVRVRAAQKAFAQFTQEQVDHMEKLEMKLLPENMDYQQVPSLRDEAREKLSKIRPRSVGQAGRISGVSPADVSVLLVYLEQQRRQKERKNELS